MMTNQVLLLQQWLKSRHSVLVPDDWLEACLEWIQEENEGTNLGTDTLKNQVYEQWLLADLRELKTSCLPSTILTSSKSSISGRFAVQIDSAVNVGTSFYSQMQKVKGTENTNSQVSADDMKQPYWEPKPTRMIVLNLTDGVIDVKAMEYKPIAALSPFIAPGMKILIKGTILCRRGILMLTPDNVQLLGGEVDSLMETNTPQTVLENAMRESEENSGKSERQEFSGRMLSKGERPEQKHMIKQERNKTVSKTGVSQHLFNNTQAHGTQMNAGRNTGPSYRKQQPDIKIESTDPDFEDDFDYDALMADMECEEQTKTTTSAQPSAAVLQVKQEPQSQQILASSHLRSDLSNDMADYFIDDFDDDFDVPTVTKPVPNVTKPTRTIVKQKSVYKTATNYESVSETSSWRMSERTSFSSSDRIQPKREGMQETFGLQKSFCSSDKGGQLRKRNIRNSDGMHVLDQCDMDTFQDSSISNKPVNQNLKRFKTESFGDIPESSKLKQNILEQNNNVKVMEHRLPNKHEISSLEVVPKAVIHPFSAQKESIVGPKSAAAGQSPLGRAQAQMDRFLTSPCSFVSEQSETYRYLSDFLPSLPVTETKTILIKGYISTLTSKLTSCGGKVWSLSCKINDGTAALNVDLANSVLTKLIGFSAEDSVVMKQRARTDPTVKDVLTEGLQQCQQSLTDLSCLMRIELQPQQSKPVLVQLIPVTNNHVQSLINSVASKYVKH